jgi:CheY-like chemotaxis protein
LRAVVLDIQLAGEDTWGYLARLKSGDGELPVVVVTSVDDQAKAASLGADAYAAKPIDRSWLVRRLRELTGLKAARAVVIDDEDAARYVLRSLLGPLGFEVSDCAHPEEGLRQVQADRPDVVFLDLVMPGMTGLEVLEGLRQDPRTRELPTVLITSKVLAPSEREAAERLGASVVSKDVLGHPQAAAEIQQALVRAGWTAEAQPPAREGKVARS